MKTRTISLSLVILSALTIILFSCRHEILPIPGGGSTGGGGTTGGGTTGGGGTTTDTTVCFESQILPLYQSSCAMAGCHDAATQKEGYNLTTYAGITARGISPGNPSKSRLYTILSGSMPPRGYTAMTADQKAIIAKWISQGAKNTTGCNSGCDTTQFAFAANIKPILSTYCNGCHSGTSASAGIDLSTYAGVLVVANNGKLYGSVAHLTGYFAMPQGAAQLSACQIRIIQKWVQAGAANN
jgi:uncharacterized membrane protein